MILKFFSFLCLTCTLINAHIRLRSPPQRSSVWRDPAFASFHPEPNYDDWSLNCGAIHQSSDLPNCGLCGDSMSAGRPRDNENGGKYGKGIIVGNFKRGQEIPITLEIYPTHLGHFKFFLCDSLPESEECFKPIALGNGQMEQRVVGTMPKMLNTTVRLPEGVHCQRCVLRVQYFAGNNWGTCTDGSSGVGCGPQEAFRNCADITIT